MKQLELLLEQYLDVRWALGGNLKQTAWLLCQFLAFLANRKQARITVNSALTRACEPQNVSDAYRYRRLAEVRKLTRTDVDLDQGIITIQHTKFGKSRLLVCHLSTQQVLRQYATKRDQLLNEVHSDAFFLSDRGTCIAPATLQQTFVKLSNTTGLRSADSPCKPRLLARKTHQKEEMGFELW